MQRENYKKKYLELKQQYKNVINKNLELKKQVHNLTIEKNTMSDLLDSYKLKNSKQEKILYDIFKSAYNQTTNPRKVLRIKNILLKSNINY